MAKTCPKSAIGNGGHKMSNETPSVTDPTIFAAVFNENWQNARNIKSERISFMNTFSLVSAGVLTLLQSVRGNALLEISLLLFMCLFSVVGPLTSLRLKGELEECLAKIEAMTLQAKVSQFVALGQLEGKSSQYPRFRWIFPIFYAMTTAGFITLIVYRLVTGEAMK
jgi:xanthine/uracil permease